MGDLTAILLTLKNGRLRRRLAESSGGKFAEATTLSSLAEQFGKAVKGGLSPHRPQPRHDARDGERNGRPPAVRRADRRDVRCLDRDRQALSEERRQPPRTAKEVFWDAADRMQRTAIQPLDLLPPVEVTFRDYALAVCRSQQLADPSIRRTTTGC
jgi:hypothetical protein